MFDLERRIYRIDRVRLNPGGIPVRGLAYFLSLLLTTLVAERLPLVRLVGQVVPWYVRDLGFPLALSSILGVIRIEGRPFHLAARSLLACAVGPRRRIGLIRPCRSSRAPFSIWRPDRLVMVPDGSDSRMRSLSYRGPGALFVAVAHERRLRRGPLVALRLRSELALRELDVARPARGEIVVLDRGARLRVG
ncbi:MAG TPA: hypothetical protein VN672_08515 [Solirubrobacteraceae bacterium]|nr:hypothetical protein [Solirubrobacteraceae bacterium]